MQQAEHLRKGIRTQGLGAGEVLTGSRNRGESYAELAHDARNMVTALALYCELLGEPGVLTEGAGHFAQELRVVTAASSRLLEKLARVEERGHGNSAATLSWRSSPLIEALRGTRLAEAQDTPGDNPGSPVGIESLAGELECNSNLLAAVAGPGVRLRFLVTDGDCAVGLSGEDLTRVLVNLVRNSTEAMRGSGSITITLSESGGKSGCSPFCMLTVEDSGPGFQATDLEQAFKTGFRNSDAHSGNGGKSRRLAGHRGLGLSIVRNLVEAAGGRIAMGNCAAGGARVSIELPVLNRN